MEIEILQRIQAVELAGIDLTGEFKIEIKYAMEHAVMLKCFELRSKHGYSPFKPDYKYFGGGAGPSSPAATQVGIDSAESSPSSVASSAPKKIARGLF